MPIKKTKSKIANWNEIVNDYNVRDDEEKRTIQRELHRRHNNIKEIEEPTHAKATVIQLGSPLGTLTGANVGETPSSHEDESQTPTSVVPKSALQIAYHGACKIMTKQKLSAAVSHK